METSSRSSLPFIASGWDGTQLLVLPASALVACAVLGTLALQAFVRGWLAWLPRPWPAIAFAVLALGGLALAPLRYRLRIGVEGIECAALSLLCVPLRRTRFPLDAELDDYWPFECDEPEGICIRPSWLGDGNGEEETDCFGPRGLDATTALLEKARAALGEARRAAEVFVPRLRCAVLERQLDALALDRAERSGQGRILGAETIAALRVGSSELAPGAKLRFNRPGYIASSRPDRLTEASCAGPSKLSHGLFARAGTKLAFHPCGALARVEGAAPGQLAVDGFAIDAAACTEWDLRGALMSGILAEPRWVRSIAFPAGCAVQARGFRQFDLSLTLRELRSPRKGGFCITLPSKLSLPDLELQAGDQVLVDRKLRKLIGVISRREIVVDGQSTHPRFLPLPLRADGSIDRGRRLARFLAVGQRH